MDITFWVTKDCNLRCRYCYEIKKNDFMDMKVAAKAVTFALNKLNNCNDKKNTIAFHGGEPFLNFKVIKYILENIKIGLKGEKEIRVRLTTNGTIINQEIIDFIKKHIDYSFSISIDGDKESHDLNRIFKDESGTFDIVEKNIRKLKQSGVSPRLRMTVTPATLKNLYTNYIYLHKKGYGNVSFALDFTTEDWNTDNMFLYLENYEKILMYLKENDYYNFECKLKNIIRGSFSKKGKCGGGHNNYHIDTNGNIYPCSYALVGKEFQIGNVFDGTDNREIEKLDALNRIVIDKCEDCKYKEYCSGNRCKVVNKCVHGEFDNPGNLQCLLNKFNHKIVVDNVKYINTNKKRGSENEIK